MFDLAQTTSLYYNSGYRSVPTENIEEKTRVHVKCSIETAAMLHLTHLELISSSTNALIVEPTHVWTDVIETQFKSLLEELRTAGYRVTMYYDGSGARCSWV